MRLAAVFLAIPLSALPCTARANPHALPFSYPYATSPQGGVELEQHLDFVPLRVERQGDAGTDAVTSARFNLVTEIEYGITDRLEFGGYLVAQQAAGSSVQPLVFQGIKQRLRYRFGAPGQLPVDVGVYFEVAEFHNEIELEQKLLLEFQRPGWTVQSNLWVEQEYYFQEDRWLYVYNPTLGAALELTPCATAGLEYWNRGHFDRAFSETVHYLGPAAHFKAGEAWATAGLYARLDTLGSAQRVGDPWGQVWLRVLLGIGL